MRKLIMSACMLFAASVAFSQSEDNCYESYYKLFDERGAYQVDNGWHNNVIISVEKNIDTECFMGKVKVTEGRIEHILVMYSDETYEAFDKDFLYKKGAMITNGISGGMLTKEDELVRIIFVENLKPPLKKPKKAPDPRKL